DVLECDASLAGRASDGETQLPSLARPANETVALRCLDGSQVDWFDASEFFGTRFSVTPASNRMGLRLARQALTKPAREIVSEPVCPGTVQVLNDGQCVILGVDAQTIGGYPKVAQVIAADLDLVGQLRPGQGVRFVPVTMEDAEAAFSDRERNLQDIIRQL